MKRGLQIVVGVLSLIPMTFGLMNMWFGAARYMPAEAVTAAIDSQFRYQSAIYVGIAAIIWWALPNIEKHTALFRIIIAALFTGGLMRLYSYMTVGEPPVNMMGGMILELATPLLVLWHNKVKV